MGVLDILGGCNSQVKMMLGGEDPIDVDLPKELSKMRVCVPNSGSHYNEWKCQNPKFVGNHWFLCKVADRD